MTNLSARLLVVLFLLAAERNGTVNFAAGALPENIPDFSQDTSRPAVQSVRSGGWSNPSTWGGAVPTANHVVRIVQGHIVTIDDTSAVAYTIAVDGKLAFATTINTRLKVTNLEVMAGNMGMGTPGVTGINIFGKVSMHGGVTTPTFLRLATEPHAGNTTLTLSVPVSGWKCCSMTSLL